MFNVQEVRWTKWLELTECKADDKIHSIKYIFDLPKGLHDEDDPAWSPGIPACFGQ